jgi:hypothetical protein
LAEGGRILAVEPRRCGHFRVVRRKYPQPSQVVYQEDQVAILPARRKGKRRER